MKLIANEWFSLQPAGYHFNEVNTPLRMGAIPCVDTSLKKNEKSYLKSIGDSYKATNPFHSKSNPKRLLWIREIAMTLFFKIGLNSQSLVFDNRSRHLCQSSYNHKNYDHNTDWEV